MEEKNVFVEETLKSGVSPLSTTYFPVYDSKTRQITAYRSELLISSLELGVLAPEQYRIIADRTTQGAKLATWQLKSVCNDVKRFIESGIPFKWISVYIPLRMLRKADFIKTVKSIFSANGIQNLHKFCFEFPVEILYEEQELIKKQLLALKELGIHTALLEFGNEFCPTMRLCGTPLEYVMFDEGLTQTLSRNKNAETVAAFAAEQGCKIILDGVTATSQLAEAFSLKISGFLYSRSIQKEQHSADDVIGKVVH